MIYLARVVKKVKKEKKETNDKLAMILGGIAIGLTVVCAVVFLVIYFQVNSIDAKYDNSRSMDYDTLVNEVLVNDKERSNYENTIYILVFHSDYETYPQNEFGSSREKSIQNIIKYDKELIELYDNQGVNMSDRIGFYTMDLMNEENDLILDNSMFGNYAEGPFVIKITGTTVSKTTSSLGTFIGDIEDDFYFEKQNNEDR